ncbi:competence protein ComK [Alkalihalobacillus deserti]|uniref:competence protein ComK n=1 Tax=Alkalihalobacillus deserti TaxID=2879466 RepID=UPI001D150087|nr:competence protein ComK [Alkalihalobacillus deserti]
MPKIILEHYEINPDTFALLPAYHTDYDTIVWERDQLLYVRKTPLQLLKEACLEGGAEYDGRRIAVTHKTGIQSKIPIPVNPLEHIYAFPTHSPKQSECSWIFYHHIKSIKRHPKNSTQSIITFKNIKEYSLNVSYHALDKQVQRTSYCIVRFSHRPNHQLYFN